MLQLKSAFLASLEKEEYNIQFQVHETIHALEVQQEKPKEKTPEELVPKVYHKFLKVFSKKRSTTFSTKSTRQYMYLKCNRKNQKKRLLKS